MMKAIVPLWQVNSCNKKYKKKLNGIHICAGGLGTDTCQVKKSLLKSRKRTIFFREIQEEPCRVTFHEIILFMSNARDTSSEG
jgi:hypothetical protein